MSAVLLRSLFQPCRCSYLTINLTTNRQFSASPVALVRSNKNKSKINIPSKKVMAAKARRRALKAPKHIYDKEKMSLVDAVAVLRAVEISRPNATYEIVVKTGMVRGTTIPKGRITLPREAKPKKEEKILVFADGKSAKEARDAGAHYVGGIELIDGITNGRYNDATIVLCTSELIRTITPKLGRILGPKGLMPSERRGTVTNDIAGYIQRLSGSTEWKGDKAGAIRMPVGKLFFPVDDVIKNVRHFLGSVKRATGNEKDTDANNKSKGPKTVNPIARVTLTSTQGPAIQIRDF